MSGEKTIVFFPEAAFGPALNSVGIAQACRDLGHRPVFVADAGMEGLFAEYGFEEHLIHMSEPMPPEEAARYWSDFIDGHIPNFAKSPYDQIDKYLKECREAIVETVKRLEKTPGRVSAYLGTVEAIKKAFEAAGIEFTNDDAPGVGLRGRDG